MANDNQVDPDQLTDDMIKAGIVALLACEVGAATESEIVSRVYLAMRRAARGESLHEIEGNVTSDLERS